METDDGDDPTDAWEPVKNPPYKTYVEKGLDHYRLYGMWKEETCRSCPIWNGITCFILDDFIFTPETRRCTEYDWIKFALEHV